MGDEVKDSLRSTVEAPRSILVVFLAVVQFAFPSVGFAQSAINCSMVELIARSEDCAGRRVRTIGYVRVIGEESAIYLSESDAQNGIAPNGLWLDLRSTAIRGLQTSEVTGRYAIVEGIFENLDRGTLPYTGAISDISRLEPWNSQQHIDDKADSSREGDAP